MDVRAPRPTNVAPNALASRVMLLQEIKPRLAFFVLAREAGLVVRLNFRVLTT